MKSIGNEALEWSSGSAVWLGDSLIQALQLSVHSLMSAFIPGQKYSSCASFLVLMNPQWGLCKKNDNLLSGGLWNEDFWRVVDN